MKFALVVASGVRTGTLIPAPGSKLTVGRGEGCHLRPASPSISNRHCEFVARAGVVYLRDLGSTNGTAVNDVTLTEEVALAEGDRIKVGPLDFTLKILERQSDSTPSQPKSASKSGAAKPVPAPQPAAKPGSAADDAMAAMLLGMDDDDPVEVPGGSTIMELPAVDAEVIRTAAAEAAAKKVLTQADSSSAARDLLSQYTNRPRTPPRK